MYSAYQQPLHQPSHAVATQQPGLTWNGSQWVQQQAAAAAAAAVGAVPVSTQQRTYNQYSQYESSNNSTQQQQPQQTNKRIPASNPVTTYTNYYHGWKAVATKAAQEKKVLAAAPQTTQTEQQETWANYYADLSSRAAHFFHQNPNAREAPYDLPPAPPPPSNQQPQNSPLQQPQQQQQLTNNYGTSTTPTSGNYAISNQQYQQQQQQQQLPKQQQQPPSCLSLQSYIDQCLSQCQTPAEKEQMMKQSVQPLITRSIAAGDLHSKDWSREPLLAVPGRNAAAAAAVAPVVSPRFTHTTTTTATLNSSVGDDAGDCSYYGPSAGNSSSSAHGGTKNAGKFANHNKNNSSNTKKKRKFGLVAPVTSEFDDSYYGPSSSSSSPPSSFSSSFTGKNKNKSSSPSSPGKGNGKNNNKWVRNNNKKKNGFNTTQSALGQRAKRFASSLATCNNESSPSSWDEEEDALRTSTTIVVGTCQTLEKEYFRLTSAPRAADVRPQPVLEKHLANLQSQRSSDGPPLHDYLWFCSQLKAIRQDCTVQHLQNAFCVKVYETHAKIALEEGDLNEYNQCQTQLKYLYALLLKDDDDDAVVAALQNMDEFVAYRLLYTIFLTGNEKYDGGSSDLLKIILSLSTAQRQCVPIKHALQVREAVASFDYHSFFRLLQSCPGHGKFLMYRILPLIRQHALQAICRAYRPTVSVDFVMKELGLLQEEEGEEVASDDDGDVMFGKRWLQSCGCVFTIDGKEIQTKETVVRESDLETKQSLI